MDNYRSACACRVNFGGVGQLMLLDVCLRYGTHLIAFVTFKASIHSMSKTLPGAEFDWGGTSPKQ